MPRLPSPVCDTPRCKSPSVAHSRFCADHAPAYKRGDNGELYNSSAWSTLRRSQMSKQPLCQACLLEGRITSAQHVDHVFPWRTIGKEAFRANLLQSLCGPCHSRKTGLEQKGTFRHYRRDGARDYQVSDWQAIVAQRGWEGLGAA